MQKTLFRYWIILWPLTACLFLFPINNLLLRVGLLVSLAGVLSGCFIFGRHRKILCSVLLVFLLLIGGFLIWPGKTCDRQQLRDAYVRALRSYEETRYLWGGENRFGIDCSGLVRAGLIKANVREAIWTFNPRLMRFALSLWWHDASAEALGHEYRQQTKRLLTAVNLNDLHQTEIMPGDIAVTASGVHVMAFLGDGQWIEADPNLKKVVIVQVPERRNPWFQETYKILRWRELDVE